MVQSLNSAIQDIEDKNSSSIGVLGMTYGTQDIVSTEIRSNLDNYDERAYVGREFWGLISGEEDYLDFLRSTIRDINSRLSQEYEADYGELLDKKIEELSQEWTEKYE